MSTADDYEYVRELRAANHDLVEKLKAKDALIERMIAYVEGRYEQRYKARDYDENSEAYEENRAILDDLSEMVEAERKAL